MTNILKGEGAAWPLFFARSFWQKVVPDKKSNDGASRDEPVVRPYFFLNC